MTEQAGEDMKKHTRQGPFAQGDTLWIPLDTKPGRLSAQVDPTPADEVIVAHSETGHHHVLLGTGLLHYAAPGGDPNVSYVWAGKGAKLEHRRAYDTHETVEIMGGWYEVRRQVEYTPAGWARVED